MGGVAATACGYGTTTPSPRRRAASTRPHQQETNRDAGLRTWGAPFGYLALFWTLAAFSFFWRAAQSEAERPSGTYLGVFKYRERARVRGQLSGDERQPSRVEALIYSGSILCSCARRGRRPRATASHRCFLGQFLHRRGEPLGGRPHGARRRRGARRLRGKLVVRTLDAHPFTATDGLATLRGAKAVALPASARMTEVFILQIYPLLFVEQEPRRYEHKPMCEACKLVAKKGPSGSD